MDDILLHQRRGDRTRIGVRHDGALLVLAQGRAVEIDAALASRLQDARPGINLPLRAEGRVVGVVGVSGAPDAIRQHAELVRMAAETMLEQARLVQVLARDERLREELVLQLIGAAPAPAAADDWVREWASRLDVDLALPRVALLIDIDAPALAAEAMLAAQQRLQRRLSALEPGLLSAPVSLRELAVLLPVTGGEDDPVRLRARVERLRARLGAEEAGARFALGGLFAGAEGLVRSWQSARATLRAGRRRQPDAALHCYADLTLAVLLAGLAEGWRADELRRPLQRLAAHDADGQLRRTLEVWFAHDMRTAASAAALHVHRNSVDYRLRRVAELTGLDLARLDDCLLLFIGLALATDEAL